MKIISKIWFPVVLGLSVLCIWKCVDTVLQKQKPGVIVVQVETYPVLECDYSDSITGADHKIEYSYWTNNEYIDSGAEESIHAIIGQDAVNGIYLHSENQMPNNYSTHFYQDPQNIIFATDPQGTPVFYFWGQQETDVQTLDICTEQQCVTVAQEFISSYIDVEKYEVSAVQNTDRDSYDITFTKLLNGLPTTEYAVVTVNNDGTLYSYASFMLGRLPDSTHHVFYLDSAIASVYGKLDSIYEPVKVSYTSISYGTPEFRYTVLDNGELAVYCVVDVTCENSTDGKNTVAISEKVALILEL